MKSHQERVRVFEQLNRCSDAQFVRGCGFVEGSREAQVALGIRSILGELGDVATGAICPHQTFQKDLAGLGSWDSLDQVDFMMRLEDLLDIRIPDDVGERFTGIRDDELIRPDFTVAEMIRRLEGSLKSSGCWDEEQCG
jgi:acyl carrier protein